MPGPGDNTRSKPKTNADSDLFKRSVSACMRAISGDRDFEVTFAKDRPALTANHARMPEPPRKPTGVDLSVTRGLGDSMALRHACHDTRLHNRLAPEGRQARAIYDEIARVDGERLADLSLVWS